MAFDEGLADRIRTAFRGRDDVVEKKMFGGIAFMVAGRMASGVIHDDLMVRVGPDGHDEALMQPGTRPMDFTGKPMRGMIYVAPDAIATDEALARWLDRAVAVAIAEGPRPGNTRKGAPPSQR
jgi:TfoX/Sxy family transcriptional regulator of competence genes